MAEDAPKRLGIDDGKVWRLECARAAPRACTLQCTVEVMGSRRSGSAVYDGKGKRAERADFPKYNPIDPLDPGRKGDKCRRVVLPPI